MKYTVVSRMQVVNAYFLNAWVRLEFEADKELSEQIVWNACCHKVINLRYFPAHKTVSIYAEGSASWNMQLITSISIKNRKTLAQIATLFQGANIEDAKTIRQVLELIRDHRAVDQDAKESSL